MDDRRNEKRSSLKVNIRPGERKKRLICSDSMVVVLSVE